MALGLLDAGKAAFGGIGGIGSALGDLGSTTADYNGPALDDKTGDMIKAQQAREQEGDQQYADRATAGTDQTGALKSAQDQINNTARARGGSDFQAMGAALQNKAAKSYGSDLNRMQQQALTNAPLQRTNDLDQTRQNAMTQYGVAAGIAAQRAKQIQDANSARNMMLNSILGAGGSIAGGAMANSAMPGAAAPAGAGGAAPDMGGGSGAGADPGGFGGTSRGNFGSANQTLW